MHVPDVLDAILAPVRLLAHEVWRWLPIVVALAMLSALPGIFLQVMAPEALSLLGGWMALDPDLLFTGLMIFVMAWSLKLLLELVAYMLVFIVLADLTAGRPSDLGGGLRRLASWRLQGAWIVAGLLEQTAIDLWFFGGGLLLIPFGLVTVTAYEEANGFTAFGRSLALGKLPLGQTPAGVRIAAAATAGFFVGMVVSGVLGVIEWAVTPSGTGALLMSLMSGTIPETGFSLPAYSWVDAAIGLFLAPFGLLPTVYLMALQQDTYWRVRTLEEEQGGAA